MSNFISGPLIRKLLFQGYWQRGMQILRQMLLRWLMRSPCHNMKNGQQVAQERLQQCTFNNQGSSRAFKIESNQRNELYRRVSFWVSTRYKQKNVHVWWQLYFSFLLFYARLLCICEFKIMVNLFSNFQPFYLISFVLAGILHSVIWNLRHFKNFQICWHLCYRLLK